MMSRKVAVWISVLVMVLAIPAFAAGGKYGSSSGSSSSDKKSSSSSNSTSSRPISSGNTNSGKYGSPSRPSAPVEKKADPPKYGSPTRPSAPVEVEKRPEPSKYGSPITASPTKKDDKDRNPSAATSGFSNPSKPNYGNQRAITDSSAKSKAIVSDQSAKKYAEQKAATAPPKPSYTTPSGQTVKVDTKSKSVEEIRNRPSTYHAPEARQQRMNTYVVEHHYHHDYGWYRSQPSIYFGIYEPSLFWMMAEWDLDRQARWWHNHQLELAQTDAYNKAMENAALRAKLAEMKEKPVDPEYRDPEFKEHQSDVYAQHYVEAAYNPVVVESTGPSGAGTFFFWVFVVVVAGGILSLLYWIFFGMRIGGSE